eukprot:s399_g29.t1
MLSRHVPWRNCKSSSPRVPIAPRIPGRCSWPSKVEAVSKALLLGGCLSLRSRCASAAQGRDSEADELEVWRRAVARLKLEPERKAAPQTLAQRAAARAAAGLPAAPAAARWQPGNA